MDIRRARRDEAPALAALAERAYERYVERIGRRPAPMDADYPALVDAGEVFVAHESGTIAGLIVLIRKPDHLFVENIAVDPERQSRGVGRALLTYADQAAREAGLIELRLYTNAAMTENLAIYPHLGWHETGRRTERGFERIYFAKGPSEATS